MDKDGTCKCDANWSGIICSKPTCENLDKCNDAGICHLYEKGTQTCKCIKGYCGDKCELICPKGM
ncbi:hypothetical protein HZS_1287 [Henneguya salminicola]|nr:hypothetical protein HZS_1287 [Henneguya salminicola]